MRLVLRNSYEKKFLVKLLHHHGHRNAFHGAFWVGVSGPCFDNGSKVSKLVIGIHRVQQAARLGTKGVGFARKSAARIHTFGDWGKAGTEILLRGAVLLFKDPSSLLVAGGIWSFQMNTFQCKPVNLLSCLLLLLFCQLLSRLVPGLQPHHVGCLLHQCLLQILQAMGTLLSLNCLLSKKVLCSSNVVLVSGSCSFIVL